MSDSEFELTCPAPLPPGDKILLGHGSGGRLSEALLREVFLPAVSDAGPACGPGARTLHQLDEFRRQQLKPSSPLVGQ